MGQVSLQEWLKDKSPTKLAKILGKEQTTVSHWKRGFVLPTGKMFQKLRKLSKGAISVDKSLDEHFSPANKKRHNR